MKKNKKKKNMKKRRVKKLSVKKKRPVKKKKVIKRKPSKKKVTRKKPVRKKKVAKKKKIVKRKTRRKAKPSRRVRKNAKLLAGKKAKKRKPAKKKKKKVIVKRKRRRRKVKVVRRVYSGGGALEQLFESPIKVQAMKLFFRNPDSDFLLKEAARIMRSNLAMARKEMKRLEKTGLLKSRRISPRRELFSINSNFDFFNELKELILKASPVSKEKMLKAVRGLGRMKLVLLSGLFVGNESSRADLLIVGDNINQRKLASFIKNLEAEAGTEINCVAMTTEEFNYRYDMYDRFTRDLLSDKGEFLINRLGL